MWIKITCSNCNSVFSVKEEFIWKKGKCPKCGNIIEIKETIENNNEETKEKQGLFKKNKLVFKNIWIIVLLLLFIYISKEVINNLSTSTVDKDNNISSKIEKANNAKNEYDMKVRDSKRDSESKSMSEWIYLYLTNHKELPLPYNYSIIKDNEKELYYRGKVWKELFSTIWYNGEEYWFDPLTGEYFYYYLTLDKRGFFINVCYEWKENIQTIERSYKVWYENYETYNFDLSIDCLDINNKWVISSNNEDDNKLSNLEQLRDESKVRADLTVIYSAIQSDMLKNKTSVKNYVIRNSKYEWEKLNISEKDYSSWEYKNISFISWENYYVWIINFDTLWLSGFSKDNNNYLIWVVDNSSIVYIQLFWDLEDGWNIKDGGFLHWNYVKQTDNDTEGLIKFNWKMVSYWN